MVFSLRFPHQTPVYRATCPAHLVPQDLINRTIFGEQYRSFSPSLCRILNFPLTSSSLSGPNIILSTLFSNTLSLRSSLCTEWYQVFPDMELLLISSWMEFWFFRGFFWGGGASWLTRFLDHTQRRTTVGRTPLDEWSVPSQRPLPDNTQQSQQTNAHASGGIRTHNPSRRVAADLRPRPRGHWDRLRVALKYLNCSTLRICCPSLCRYVVLHTGLEARPPRYQSQDWDLRFHASKCRDQGTMECDKVRIGGQVYRRFGEFHCLQLRDGNLPNACTYQTVRQPIPRDSATDMFWEMRR